MHTCEFFKIHELVPPHIYEDRGELAWELMDERLIITIDQLRKDFGPMTINNYFWGGGRKESGLRDVECEYFRPYSQHSFGRAADCLFEDVETESVRKAILDNPNRYPFINAVELGTSWLHIDVRNTDRIKTFYP